MDLALRDDGSNVITIAGARFSTVEGARATVTSFSTRGEGRREMHPPGSPSRNRDEFISEFLQRLPQWGMQVISTGSFPAWVSLCTAGAGGGMNLAAWVRVIMSMQITTEGPS